MGLFNPNIMSFILYFRAERAGIQRFVGLCICENVESHPGVIESTYSHLLEMMPQGYYCSTVLCLFMSGLYRRRHPAKEIRQGSPTIAPSVVTVRATAERAEHVLCAYALCDEYSQVLS